MQIPIANIYYLLCYAWNRLDEGELVEVSGIEGTDLPNLFARVLSSGIQRLMRDGFDRGYTEVSEAISTIRGRIDFGASIKEQHFRSARAVCRFDELSYDVLHNQILKATVRAMLRTDAISDEMHTLLGWQYRRMQSVSDISLARGHFRLVQLQRNNGVYRFLLDICELVFDSLLADESAGTYIFREFFRDPEKMWRVFQDFVYNFFVIENTGFTVSRPTIEWNVTAGDSSARSLIPRMETDLVLSKGARAIIVDTKFYADTLSEYRGRETIRPAHLFQLFSYLSNYGGLEGKGDPTEGVLLYPTVGANLDVRFEIEHRPVRVITVDLAEAWQDIDKRMRSITDENSRSANGPVH